MNASLDTISLQAATRPPSHASDVSVREGVLEVPGNVALHHGATLPGLKIAWRLAGAANMPVICALGGISANRRVCLTDDSRQGWWSEIVGPNKALNTNHFRVLSFDYIGGSGESSGPCAAESFPSISSYDQSEALVRLLNHLGIKSLRAIVGGSYGGMVALAFGERYPDRVSRLIVIGASDRPHPLSTAWRSVQRRVVRFAIEQGNGKEGLELARALAMSTYRSSEEFSARFGGPARRSNETERFVFPVEEYLFNRGKDYAARYLPEAFLCLSESIDLHWVEASRVFVPVTAIAAREDQLVPLGDIRGMVARLPSGRLHEISSLYGHDAFLKESDQLRDIFASILAGAA